MFLESSLCHYQIPRAVLCDTMTLPEIILHRRRDLEVQATNLHGGCF